MKLINVTSLPADADAADLASALACATPGAAFSLDLGDGRVALLSLACVRPSGALAESNVPPGVWRLTHGLLQKLPTYFYPAKPAPPTPPPCNSHTRENFQAAARQKIKRTTTAAFISRLRKSYQQRLSIYKKRQRLKAKKRQSYCQNIGNPKWNQKIQKHSERTISP